MAALNISAPTGFRHVSKISNVEQATMILLDELDFGDKTYHFRTYKNCFVASDAVDVILKSGFAYTVADAVALGQLLVDRGIIKHVAGRQTFKNEKLFFRFATHEQDDVDVMFVLPDGTTVARSVEGEECWAREDRLLEDTSRMRFSKGRRVSRCFVIDIAEKDAAQNLVEARGSFLRVIECLEEPPYGSRIPADFLGIIAARNRNRADSEERTALYAEEIAEMASSHANAGIKGRWIKKSTEKTVGQLAHLPTNLHVMRLAATSADPKGGMLFSRRNAFSGRANISPSLRARKRADVWVHETVTVGVFAAHSMAFKHGGLSRMTQEMSQEEDPKIITERRWMMMQRHNIVFCQAVTSLATGIGMLFGRALESCTGIPFVFQQTERVGVLFAVLSLLSTQGDELGMLEDHLHAVKSLSSVGVILLARPAENDVGCRLLANDAQTPNLHGRSVDYILEMSLPCRRSRLPSLLRDGGIASVTPAPINQGIDAIQSYANKFGQRDLQDINNNLVREVLEEYVARYVNWRHMCEVWRVVLAESSYCEGRPCLIRPALHTVLQDGVIPFEIHMPGGADIVWVEATQAGEVKETALARQAAGVYGGLVKYSCDLGPMEMTVIALMGSNQHTVATVRVAGSEVDGISIREAIDSMSELNACINKHVSTIKDTLLIQTFCSVARALGAIRVTCCKSAKDRTAMAVTLEQAELLTKHGLPSDRVLGVADAMRALGVRLECCLKNVGERRYAFNALQISMLPREYRPSTGSGGTTVT